MSICVFLRFINAMAPENEEPKAKSKSVSFQPDLWAKVEAKAQAEYGGNRSSYLRELVEQNLSESGAATVTASVLVDLAKSLHPTIADQVEIAVAKKAVNQPRFVAKLLEAFVEAADDEAFDPKAKVVLGDHRKLKEWDATGDDRIITVAQELAKNLNQYGARALLGLSHQIPELANSPANEEIEAERRRRAAAGAKPAAGTTPRKSAKTPSHPKR